MQGLHLTADLYGCDRAAALLQDVEALRAMCLREVRAAGLTPVGELFHRFHEAGVTGVVLLAESHLALHTWPELAAATLDVYVCNFGADNSVRAHQLIESLVASLVPRTVSRQRLDRGGRPA